MRFEKTGFTLAIASAFMIGLVVSPLARHALSDAHAQAVPLTATTIDLAALKQGDLPTTPNKEMNSRTMVATDSGTIALQAGNVAKHIHPKTDEIQYIVEGTGTMWLGGERKEFKPGTLIIVPKGVAHGGTIVTSGPVKAIAIKLPPQGKDDVLFVD